MTKKKSAIPNASEMRNLVRKETSKVKPNYKKMTSDLMDALKVKSNKSKGTSSARMMDTFRADRAKNKKKPTPDTPDKSSGVMRREAPKKIKEVESARAAMEGRTKYVGKPINIKGKVSKVSKAKVSKAITKKKTKKKVSTEKPKGIMESLKVQPDKPKVLVNDIPEVANPEREEEIQEGADVMKEKSEEYPNFWLGLAPLAMGAIMGDIGEGASVAGDVLIDRGIKDEAFDRSRKLASFKSRLNAKDTIAKPLTKSNVSTIVGPDGKPQIAMVKDTIGKTPYESDKFNFKAKAKLERLKSTLKKDGSPESSFDNELKLRKEYSRDPITTASKDVGMAYSKIQAIANAPQNGANDISLIFQYMKMLDPASTVREGEQATARTSGTIPQSVWLKYNRLFKGEDKLLPVEVRENFFKEGRRLNEVQNEMQDKVDSSYNMLAEEYKLNPSRILVNPRVTLKERVSQEPIRYPDDPEKQGRYEEYLDLQKKMGLQ